MISYLEVLIPPGRRREKILDFMTSVDPHSDQSKYIQMRQDMTGLWFTEGEEFKSWMSTKNGALWLAGIRKFHLLCISLKKKRLTLSVMR
jgi:hypothetical protein